MPHIDILVLAIVQGVTEFLPVGASAHTILLSHLFCWPANPLALLGTQLGLIAALALYFWREMILLTRGLIQVMKRKRDPRSRVLGFLLLGSIPAALISIVLQLAVEGSLVSPSWMAGMLIFFAILLFVADRFGLTVRRIEHLTVGGALLIGLVQCLDVMPGVSRFGIAFTASRFLGFERLEAARFSLLLGVPAGFVFFLYEIYLVLVSPLPLAFSAAILGFFCSFIAGFFAISFLMYWLRRASAAPFAVYRIGLGLYLLLWFGNLLSC